MEYHRFEEGDEPEVLTSISYECQHEQCGLCPGIFHLPEYVHMGGLLAYGPDRTDLFRRAAHYVDRLLRGAKPAELPVEQPNKFDLSVNLATAKAIGLAVPPLMLMQAGEVVE